MRRARETGDDAELDAALAEWEQALAPLVEVLRNRLEDEP